MKIASGSTSAYRVLQLPLVTAHCTAHGCACCFAVRPRLLSTATNVNECTPCHGPGQTGIPSHSFLAAVLSLSQVNRFVPTRVRFACICWDDTQLVQHRAHIRRQIQALCDCLISADASTHPSTS